MRVCWSIIHISQLINLLSSFVSWCLNFRIGPRTISSKSLLLLGANMVGSDSVVRWTVTPRLLRHKRSRANIPSVCNPASRKMISDSVELCDTELCFLRIQLTVKQCSTSEDTQDTPEIDFESSRPPAKSQSRNKHYLQCWAVCCRHDNIVGIRLCDEGRNQSC